MPSHPRITSRQHRVVQRFRHLAHGRDEAGVVLLDGEHLVREALAAGVPIELVLADEAHEDLAAAARQAGATASLATRAVLEAASPVRTPSGIVAAARWSPVPVASLLAAPDALIVGLVDVQDPGNVGSVIRSADALGATGVITIGTTADPAGWKALRGAMGSTFRVPVARDPTGEVLDLARSRGVRILAMVLHAGADATSADLTGPSLVLVGNEGAGLDPAIAEVADVRVSIAMRAGVDSLNVAVAAALVLDEARRQRARRGR